MITTTILAAALAALPMLQNEPLRDGKSGDRVKLNHRLEITVKSGHTIRGIVVPPDGMLPGYDPAVANTIFLDLTLEHERLNGKVSIERNNVRSARILRPLSKTEIESLRRGKARAAAELTKEDLERISLQDAAHKDWMERRSREIAGQGGAGPGEGEMSKSEEEAALKIYEEFPESEGWGEEKHARLKEFLIPTFAEDPKYLDSRKPTAGEMGYDSEGKPVPSGPSYAAADPREAKFFANFDLWKRGKEIARRRKAEEEEKKAAKPAAPETPAEPKDVYMAYRAAIQAGNLPQFKRHVASSVLREIEGDPAPEATFEIIRKSMPSGAVVLKTDTKGGQATLTVKASAGGTDLWGTVTLVREAGEWRVLKEAWSEEER
jgi:hypothetical protein